MICVIFMGIFQVSQLAVAREVLHHAAARGARARSVGFNAFMVQKSVRVAAIPNAAFGLPCNLASSPNAEAAGPSTAI